MKTQSNHNSTLFVFALLLPSIAVVNFLWIRHEQHQLALVQQKLQRAQEQQKAAEAHVKRLQSAVEALNQEVDKTEQPQYALNHLLIAALKKEDSKQALALVEAGADPNTTFPITEGKTAFMIACGARFDVNEGEGKFSPRWLDPDPHLTLAMLRHGAKVNYKDEDDHTPLHCIVGKCADYGPTLAVIKQLLTCGADVDYVDGWGKTPIDIASMYYKWHPGLDHLLRKYSKHP